MLRKNEGAAAIPYHVFVTLSPQNKTEKWEGRGQGQPQKAHKHFSSFSQKKKKK